MKKFLCYDTNDAASGKINVSVNGVLKPNSTVPSTNGTPYQQLVTDGKGGAKWEDRLAYITDPTMTELISENTIRMTVQPDGRYLGRLPTPVILSEGTTYIVKLDGVEYESVCKVFDGQDGLTAYIGNLTITGVEADVDDTGEPYCYVGPFSGPGDDYGFFTTTGERHTFSLSANVGTVVPLDKKFTTSIVRVVDFPENWTTEETKTYFDAFSTGTVLICYQASTGYAYMVLALVPSDDGNNMIALLPSKNGIKSVICGQSPAPV